MRKGAGSPWKPMALLALVLFGSCGHSAEESEPRKSAAERPAAAAEPEGIVLSAADQEHLGLALAKLKPAARQARAEGMATIVAVAALSDLDADLAAAKAASAASGAALDRAEALYADQTSVSLAAVEAARRQRTTDITQVERLERILALDWGPRASGSPLTDGATRRRWLDRLAAGKAVLARVQFPLGTELPERTPTLRFERLAPAGSAPKGAPVAEAIWPAAEDPALPGPSFFALLLGPHLPRTGERLRATADLSTRRSGVSIPESAVVLSAGGAWCFVATGSEGRARRFVRRPIALALGTDGPAAEGDGYFAATGFAPGDSVVVRGAGLLLSREVGATLGDAAEEEP